MFVLPIYYQKELKRKKKTTNWLIGMNWYATTYRYQINEVKAHYHKLIADQVTETTPVITGKYSVEANIYYKNVNSDPSNIHAVVEKFALDGLQEMGIVPQDNMKYHVGTTYRVVEKDSDNPRYEFKIIPEL